ncbi:MAG: hypothetical protein KDC77_13495, partial [Cyclobacteriaceae bacterium]|nr:hypothetical protein [Cyclobacteriaceae bacterium]
MASVVPQYPVIANRSAGMRVGVKQSPLEKTNQAQVSRLPPHSRKARASVWLELKAFAGSWDTNHGVGMPSGRASPDTARHCEPKRRNVGRREAIPFGKDKSGTSLPL